MTAVPPKQLLQLVYQVAQLHEDNQRGHGEDHLGPDDHVDVVDEVNVQEQKVEPDLHPVEHRGPPLGPAPHPVLDAVNVVQVQGVLEQDVDRRDEHEQALGVPITRKKGTS